MENQSSSGATFVGVATKSAVLVLILATVVYGLYQHKVARHSAAENQQLSTALKQTQSQIDTLNARLGAMQVQQQDAVVVTPFPVASAKPPAADSRTRVRRAASSRHRADDPRWKQFAAQMAENKQAIESTRGELASARTDLEGSIARTHGELVAFQKKGERSYYEFDIDKSKQFRRSGPVGIRLKKANTKNQFADLELMVDDVKLTKKHVNLYEPAVFYATENGRPVELVINSISKNHIRGYVSQPKYAANELAAMDGSAAESQTVAVQSGSDQEIRLKQRAGARKPE